MLARGYHQKARIQPIPMPFTRRERNAELPVGSGVLKHGWLWPSLFFVSLGKSSNLTGGFSSHVWEHRKWVFVVLMAVLIGNMTINWYRFKGTLVSDKPLWQLIQHYRALIVWCRRCRWLRQQTDLDPPLFGNICIVWRRFHFPLLFGLKFGQVKFLGFCSWHEHESGSSVDSTVVTISYPHIECNKLPEGKWWMTLVSSYPFHGLSHL